MKKRKPRIIFKLVVVVFAVYAAITLLTLQADINSQKALSASLSEELSAQKLTNAALEEDIASKDELQTKIRVARKQFNLVFPGEQIVVGIK